MEVEDEIEALRYFTSVKEEQIAASKRSQNYFTVSLRKSRENVGKNRVQSPEEEKTLETPGDYLDTTERDGRPGKPGESKIT
jgi:hypothetical protein